MRIISDFYDYYDKVAGMYYDPGVVYNRAAGFFNTKLERTYYTNTHVDLSKDKELLKYLEKENLVSPYSQISSQVNLVVNTGFISIAEKLYPFICKNIAELKLANFNPKNIDILEEVLEKKKARNYSSSWLNRNQSLSQLKTYNTNKLRELHFQCKSPVLLLFTSGISKENKIDIVEEKTPAQFDTLILANPNLSLMNFNKVVDPYTIYQEITMYISGVLGQETNPTVEISDKDMAHKKGFGHKYAFRKEPKSSS